ncbi:MAG: hypothetical protein LBU70_00980 [Chitinispirillales bacterium]|nr:hypothetical protein [Chitinispirillales bacterium]
MIFDEERIASIKQSYFGRNLFAKKLAYSGVLAGKMDRHKVIALYIQLFLEAPVFNLGPKRRNKDNPTPAEMLINEKFCLDIMCAILTKWPTGKTGKTFDSIKFADYKVFFLKLLQYYKNNCSLPNYYKSIEELAERFEFDKSAEYYKYRDNVQKKHVFSTYALAHIVYFIEENFIV